MCWIDGAFVYYIVDVLSFFSTRSLMRSCAIVYLLVYSIAVLPHIQEYLIMTRTVRIVVRKNQAEPEETHAHSHVQVIKKKTPQKTNNNKKQQLLSPDIYS